jgi:hypothetical protein
MCLVLLGKRLFKKWLTHPLLSIEAMNDRYDAVEDFQRGLLDSCNNKYKININILNKNKYDSIIKYIIFNNIFLSIYKNNKFLLI